MPLSRMLAVASADFKSQLPRTAYTVYLALLSGHLGGIASTIVCRSPICRPSQGDKGYRLGGGQSQGRTAITLIHPISEHHVTLHDARYPVTFCEMRPITSIPDQLKLHSVAIGHPIFGDYYYTNDRLLDAHYKAGTLLTMPRGIERPSIQPWLSAPGIWQEEHLRAHFPKPVAETGDAPRWIVRWPSRLAPTLPEHATPPETLEEVVMQDEIGSIVGMSALKPFESSLRHLRDIESLVRQWGFNEEDHAQLGEIRDPRYTDRDVFFDQPRKWIRKL